MNQMESIFSTQRKVESLLKAVLMTLKFKMNYYVHGLIVGCAKLIFYVKTYEMNEIIDSLG